MGVLRVNYKWLRGVLARKYGIGLRTALSNEGGTEHE